MGARGNKLKTRFLFLYFYYSGWISNMLAIKKLSILLQVFFINFTLKRGILAQ